MANDRSLQGLKILIVEDEYLLADDARQLLECRGATIIGPVADVAQARAVLAGTPADLAVLDVNLGKGDVLPLASEFVDRGMPFLFLTGYSADVLPAEFGDVPVIRKPCEDDRLVEAIASLSEGRFEPIRTAPDVGQERSAA